ncbi:uncharacterized protein SOCEGT47_063270 [Sorangium cellulosum]|uniref:Secreted protein n=1 Tax=Sorangium cellulosum TaxID=56 RepID=A0A4P2Q8B5_SORCE|nr:hypothetical protein [Sorangium cellulosum]AUX25775.1 uncharacterized protein SOCEGT47_063270 [Sorangium cellulosum]
MRYLAVLAVVGVVSALAPTSPPVIGIDAAGAHDCARQQGICTEPSSGEHHELLVFVGERHRPADREALPGR